MSRGGIFEICRDIYDMDEESINFQRYLNQMSLIKLRQSVISNIMSKRTTTGYLYSDIEICVLQIRKIIELIAMGSIVSNIEEYSKIHDKYQKEWNAKHIFRDIERINPRFYPKPIDIDKSGVHDRFVPISTGYLTKEEAIELYDKCNAFLHENNPFKTSHEVSYYEERIPIWNLKIIKLLNRHLVHIYDDYMYFVVMKSEKDGNPSGNIFEAIVDANVKNA